MFEALEGVVERAAVAEPLYLRGSRRLGVAQPRLIVRTRGRAEVRAKEALGSVAEVCIVRVLVNEGRTYLEDDSFSEVRTHSASTSRPLGVSE